MTGILETQVARIDVLEQTLAKVVAHLQAGTPTPAPVQPTPALTGFGGVTAAAPDPFGVLGGATVANTPTVTPEMMQQLIMPLIPNEAAKAALGSHMQAMGIANLADVQPAQMGELYQRFQQVAAQFSGAGGPQPAAAAPSII